MTPRQFRVTYTSERGDTDPRAAMAGALARMTEAHDALLARVTDDTLRAYVDSCNAARLAFEAMVLAGYERAKARRLEFR